MEGFVYSPFGTYQSFRGSLAPGRSRDPAAKQPSWKQSKGGGISPVLGGPLSPLPSDYLDSYRRAQLQALLSQVNPGLAPRLRRAITREVGVQVNLRADAAVQCSLGPRTLPVGHPLSPAALRAHGHFALYSPVRDHRRLVALPEAAGPREKEEASETTPDVQKAEDGGSEQQEGRAETALQSEETAGEGAAAAPRRRAAFQVCSAGAWGEAGTCCRPRWARGVGGGRGGLARNPLLGGKRHSGPHPGSRSGLHPYTPSAPGRWSLGSSGSLPAGKPPACESRGGWWWCHEGAGLGGVLVVLESAQ